MKKKIILGISILVMTVILSGCGKMTPKKKVEALLMSYQNNSDNIISELDDYLKTITSSNEDFDNYKKVYLRQYQDLKYEVKDETIDGDNAVVIAQIDVYDYYKVENDVNNYIASNSSEFNDNGIFDSLKALKYRMDELSKANDRVTYTIEFNLTKVNDNWTINNLTEEDLEKIHGTYAH